LPRDWVLIIDKPAGITSRRAAEKVRHLAGCSKAGHAGTLDPLATGVLVVCLDRATLLTSYLGGGTKVYQVEALLGTSTDTYDVDGKVVATRDAAGVTAAAVEGALGSFLGEVLQVAPPFSAVKHHGRALYSYAREGADVPRITRTVAIEEIALQGLSECEAGPTATLRVACGPGTYVRSIVHDLGEELGCGACVSSLRRTASGRFDIADAVTFDELELGGEGEGATPRGAMSIEEAMSEMPGVNVGLELAEAVAMGKPIEAGSAEVPTGVVFRLQDDSGRLIALYGPARPEDEGIAARAVRVLRPHGEGNDGEAA